MRAVGADQRRVGAGHERHEPERLVVPDGHVGPLAADEPLERARLRLAPGPRPGKYVPNGRPRARQRNGKLRLRSTPRAFWRVPPRRRRDWRWGRAGGAGRPARPSAAAAPRRRARRARSVDRAHDEDRGGRLRVPAAHELDRAALRRPADDLGLRRRRDGQRQRHDEEEQARASAASLADGLRCVLQGADPTGGRPIRGTTGLHPLSPPTRARRWVSFRAVHSAVVVGAGTFGARSRGGSRARVAVTLVDQFEPGDRARPPAASRA